MSDSDQSEIIQDILDQARQEAEEISRKNDESLKRRRESLDQQITQILKDTRDRTAQQVDRLKTQYERNQSLEERRIQLELQERIVTAVTDGARKDIAGVRGSGQYAEMIRDWTVEALLGLGSDTAEIRCAESDRKTIEGQMPAIRNTVKELTGTAPELSIADAPLAPESIGVVVVDATGRQAYSNRLEDRVRRAGDEIRRIVVEELFGEEHE